MGYLRYLEVLFVLTLAAISKTEAAEDLYAICRRLDVGTYRDVSPEVQEDYRSFYFQYATKRLHKLWTFSNLGEVSLLQKAWRKQITRETCYPDALRDAACIARCRPDQFKSLSTLVLLGHRLADDCLTPQYIASQIESAIGRNGCLLGACFGGTRGIDLFDSSFVSDYRKENNLMHDKWLDLDEISVEKALMPVYKSIDRQLREKSQDSKKKEFKWNMESMSKYLEKNLYRPCSSYVAAANLVMNRLYQAGELRAGGLKYLLNQLDEETQKAVFSYALCKRFIDENSPALPSAEISRLLELSNE